MKQRAHKTCFLVSKEAKWGDDHGKLETVYGANGVWRVLCAEAWDASPRGDLDLVRLKSRGSRGKVSRTVVMIS